MNPILLEQYHIPDAEAHQWKDGRIYLYGSYDISGDDAYCSHKYHVFSSDDLTNWVDHGESFNVDSSHASDVEYLYAPDCFYKDNRYHLLYCMNDGTEGVAVSDYPEGPFSNGKLIEGAKGIDPTALVDDDGSIYYFWGQNYLKGARLNSDLSIEEESLKTSLLSEELHGFHEGASIRKRNGIYYMLFADISRGSATVLSYATSDAPLGPYQKRGTIIDNIGCDPENWNNHGSLAEFNGKWYIFYHRSSQSSKYSRRVCVEPITFNSDGAIDEVEMTTQGVSASIDPTSKIDGYRACLFHGQICSKPLTLTKSNSCYQENLTSIHDGDWAGYKYLNFSKDVTQFSATVSSIVDGGAIEVRCDSPDGVLLCECAVLNTKDYNHWVSIYTTIDPQIKGVHAIYLVFKGGKNEICNLLNFTFKL